MNNEDVSTGEKSNGENFGEGASGQEKAQQKDPKKAFAWLIEAFKTATKPTRGQHLEAAIASLEAAGFYLDRTEHGTMIRPKGTTPLQDPWKFVPRSRR